ncbi:stimulated by retinoic acid gene 6 protein-like [Haliotis rufescens]|uniref:stimulated by retinoic acid gene 6 protein-like n=1 Tax=Haliotis rufescens TaxID=6454 RepID=UPI00201F474B|nr:stimulated by retinoic acid gene 6 protein-like [Haliotis rufescens]
MAASGTDVSCQHTITLQDFTHFAVGPALFIIFILSLLEKRRNAKRCRCFGDRPGLLVPVNLLDGDEDRFAYAAAFGSTATSCLILFGGDYIPDNSPMWSQVFLAMMAVTEMGIDYYPFFACLAKKNSFVWSLIGLAYSILWFLVNLAHVFECVDASDWVFTGQPVVIQLPVLACLLYLVITFLIRVIVAILSTLRSMTESYTHNTDATFLIKDKLQAPHQLMKYHQAKHVTELLKGKHSSLPPILTSADCGSGLWNVLNVRQDPTFRYSPRITVTVTVAMLCLYEFGLLSFLTIEKALGSAKASLQNATVSSSMATVFGPGMYNQMKLLLHVGQMSWYAAFGVSSVVIVNYIIRIFVSYKVQLKRLMRGDHSFIPKHCSVLPRSKIVAHSLMYSGSQIAYILWGYYVMILSIFTSSMLLAYLFILPLLGFVSSLLLEPFWTIIPTVLVSYTVYYLQVLVSKKALLQNEHFCNSTTNKVRRVLALDNRRIFHNVSYFLFFYHILLGLYTCLVRIGKGILLGVVFLGRIDRSGLVKGFEHWDTGYLSFVSFLQVELAHTHPVLVVFCQLLMNGVRDRRLARFSLSQDGHTGSPYKTFGDVELLSMESSYRVRTRWLKAYTLIRNPALRQSQDSSHEDWQLQHLKAQ